MEEPLFRRIMFLWAGVTLCILLNSVSSESIDGSLTACEIETLVRQLISPNQEYQLHAAALRNQLRNLLENGQSDSLQGIDEPTGQFLEFDKRLFSALSAPGKLNMDALAQSELLRPSEIDVVKRSLATLAKNGQLPSQEPDVEYSTQQWEGKRNLGSLARSGYIMGKRNIGSLARDYQLPSSGKRNLAALARLGFVPSTTPKRNIASLARLNLIPTNSYNNKREAKYWLEVSGNASAKKNIGALKSSPIHGPRQKRSLYQGMLNEEKEVPEDVFQNVPIDYEELRDGLDRMFGQYYPENIQEEKRFLGSLARNGWFSSRPIDKRNIDSLARLGLLRPDFSHYKPQGAQDSYGLQEQKRHIGALARSGWLPAFRPARSGRFSRSGRARSQIVGYYPQQEQLRQPIAAVCRRCDDGKLQNSISWGAPGLQTTWGTPPRLTALHWRSLRPTGTYY